VYPSIEVAEDEIKSKFTFVSGFSARLIDSGLSLSCDLPIMHDGHF
jgi:hypothetical protein